MGAYKTRGFELDALSSKRIQLNLLTPPSWLIFDAKVKNLHSGRICSHLNAHRSASPLDVRRIPEQRLTLLDLNSSPGSFLFKNCFLDVLKIEKRIHRLVILASMLTIEPGISQERLTPWMMM